MISASMLVLVIWAHYVGDFLFQTREMATWKSSSNAWLFRHVVVYSFFLLPFGIGFAVVNLALHFVTDFVSSRIASRMWHEKRTFAFFAVIGADQALHMTALVTTLQVPELVWW